MATSPSGGKYIGITQQKFQTRKMEHLRRANSGSTKALHNAIRKYGEENINWEIVDTVDNFEKLKELEIYYIEKFDSYNNGYNETLGGEGTVGFKATEEQIAANKKRRKEHFKNPENKIVQSKANKKAHDDNPQLGEKHSQFMKKRFENKNEREKVAEGMRRFLQDSQKLEIHSIQRGAKPFFVFKDEVVVGEWLTISQCARDLNLNASHISHCLHKKRQTHKGYTFSYNKGD